MRFDYIVLFFLFPLMLASIFMFAVNWHVSCVHVFLLMSAVLVWVFFFFLNDNILFLG